MELSALARALIVLGAILLLAGLVLLFVERLPGVGRLPGDLLIQRGNVTIYFPFLTCLLGSIILTVILNVIARIVNR